MTGAKTALEWLASAAPDPGACRREWERSPLGIALLPAGKAWDVVILPDELGCPTLDVVTRVLDRPGPVLVDVDHARMGFLVPPGTAAAGSARASVRRAPAPGSSCRTRGAPPARSAG